MRAMLLAATGLVACLGLAGCDNPAPAPVAQAAPPCNCQTATAPTTEPALRRLSYRHHFRHAAAYSHSEYDASEAYSSYSSQSQYSSQSRSTSEGEGQSSGEAGAGQKVWVDGYGRSHYAQTASAATTSNDRARLAPWHGYDEDCDGKK